MASEADIVRWFNETTDSKDKMIPDNESKLASSKNKNKNNDMFQPELVREKIRQDEMMLQSLNGGGNPREPSRKQQQQEGREGPYSNRGSTEDGETWRLKYVQLEETLRTLEHQTILERNSHEAESRRLKNEIDEWKATAVASETNTKTAKQELEQIRAKARKLAMDARATMEASQQDSQKVIDSLHETIKTLETEKNLWTQDKSQLEAQLKSVETREADSKSQVKTLREQIEQLQQSVDKTTTNKESVIDILRQEVSALTQEKDAVVLANASLQKNLEEAKEIIIQVKQAFDHSQDQIRVLEQGVAKQGTAFHERIEQLENQLADSTKEVEEQATELMNLRDRLMLAKEAVIVASTKANKFEQELNRVSSQAKKVQPLEMELQSSKSKCLHLEHDLESKTIQNKTLQAEMYIANDRIQELNHENDRLNTELQAAKSTCLNLEHELESKTIENKTLHAQAEEANQRIQELTGENYQLQTQTEQDQKELERTVQQLSTVKTQLTASITQLEQTNDSRAVQLQEAAARIKDLEGQLEAAQLENDTVKKLKDDIEATYTSELSQFKTSMQEEQKEDKMKLLMAEQESRDLLAKTEEMQTFANTIEGNLKQANATIQTLRDENRHLSAERYRLIQERDSLQVEMDALQRDVMQAQSSIHTLTREKDEVAMERETLLEQRGNLQSEVENLQQHKVEATETIQSYVDNLGQVTSEREKIQREHDDLKAQLEGLNQEYQNSIAKFQADLEEMQTRNKTVEKTLDELSMQRTVLEKEKTKLQSIVNDLRASLEQAQADHEQEKSRFSETKSLLVADTDEKTKLQSQLETAQRNVKELQESNETLEAALNDANVKYAQEQALLADTSARLAVAEESHKSLQNSFKAMESALQSSQGKSAENLAKLEGAIAQFQAAEEAQKSLLQSEREQRENMAAELEVARQAALRAEEHATSLESEMKEKIDTLESKLRWSEGLLEAQIQEAETRQKQAADLRAKEKQSLTEQVATLEFNLAMTGGQSKEKDLDMSSALAGEMQRLVEERQEAVRIKEEVENRIQVLEDELQWVVRSKDEMEKQMRGMVEAQETTLKQIKEEAQATIQHLVQEREEALTSKKVLEEDVKRLTEEYKNAEESRQQFQASLDAMRSNLKILEGERSDLKLKLLTLEGVPVDEASTAVPCPQEELDPALKNGEEASDAKRKLDAPLEDAQLTIQRLRIELEKISNIAKIGEEGFAEEKEALLKKVASLENSILKLRDELGTLRAKAVEDERRFADEKKAMSKRITELEMSLDLKANDIEEVEVKLQTTKVDLVKLVEEHRGCHAMRESLVAKVTQTEDMLHDLRTKEQELMESLTELLAEREANFLATAASKQEFEAETKQLREELESYKEIASAAQEAFAASKSVQERYSQTIEALEEASLASKSAKEKYSRQIEDLKSILEETKKRLADTQHRLDTVQADNDELEKALQAREARSRPFWQCG